MFIINMKFKPKEMPVMRTPQTKAAATQIFAVVLVNKDRSRKGKSNDDKALHCYDKQRNCSSCDNVVHKNSMKEYGSTGNMAEPHSFASMAANDHRGREKVDYSDICN